MRCPKCGYISFDHVDTCLKCNKDISAISSKVAGTTYNVAAPSFLRFTKKESGEKEDSAFAPDHDDHGMVDPDLEVLADDDAEDDDDGATISFGDDFEGFGGLEDEEKLEVADSDDDSDIDLGQFEDAFEEEQVEENDQELALEFPDELSDISDLSAPAGDKETQPGEAEPGVAPAFASTGEKEASDDFTLDLDLEGLDDDLSLTTEDDTEQQDDEDDLGDLSLDDLGLSSEAEAEPVAEAAPAKKKEKDDMDMDGDLDFDLDLDGISLDNDD
ncbi:MAG: hypothetical protein ABR512_04020 [Desulfopila sp.]